MIHSLKAGDKVLTTAGIFGEIEAIRDDRLKIKVDVHTALEIHRSFISSKL
jgi:preprotein translocase YajC subunit